MATPETDLFLLASVVAGIALGTASGLTPGLHANNFALLLAAVAPAVPAPPTVVVAAMLAAGVTHTFLDAVPALALGVPDAAMAASALPGHRLVLAGRGREALRLSVLGSAGALVVSVPVAVPATAAMTAAYPTIRAHLSLVLAGVVALTLATEVTWRARGGGLVVLALAGGLGVVALPLEPRAPLPASVLTPLFAGLFGAPVLLDALEGAGVPPQDGTGLLLAPRSVALATAAGACAGGAVGYLPGVSSAIAATAALAVLPGDAGDRGYVVATSGVNTANSIFALFALVALGTPRTGVLVAVDRVGGAPALGTALLVVVLAGAVATGLVLTVGDRYLSVVGALDPRRLSVGALVLLTGLSWLFAGGVGLLLFVTATAIGLVPPRLGTRRVYCMGVLLVPLAL
ncbi:tripartite tricarboxylate transporter permease [Haloarchaeobius amylolyticus]|uniref:tripartite tricarboxylate transporter permease n=1 Tax=Haloarchaeobius amylolyticus TaxID=1198296 RepID=UPI002270271E|nr:tripartite tricarboxylate transporter permease [Haloarchaeobius amylolyticus]